MAVLESVSHLLTCDRTLPPCVFPSPFQKKKRLKKRLIAGYFFLLSFKKKTPDRRLITFWLFYHTFDYNLFSASLCLAYKFVLLCIGEKSLTNVFYYLPSNFRVLPTRFLVFLFQLLVLIHCFKFLIFECVSHLAYLRIFLYFFKVFNF